jgi:transmembrane sensor
MNYIDFSVEDFASDPLFVQWVKNPDPKLNLFWHELLNQYPEKRPTVMQAKEIVLFLSFEAITPSKEEMQDVHKGIKKQIQDSKVKDRHSAFFRTSLSSFLKERRGLSRLLLQKKAILAAGALCAAFLLLFQLYQPEVEFITGFGEMKTLVLPDGSSITLNANSKIRYAASWNNNQDREVWLAGEAFFEVMKKPDWENPRFVVHTDDLMVEVLGTSFNVNNRRGKVKVMLQSGKVVLKQEANPSNSPVEMMPKELVEFDEQQKTLLKKVVEPDLYLSWLRSKLIYEDTPVEEIAQQLEDMFGVKIHFKDERLRRSRFTGSVPNQKLDLFLQILAESLNLGIIRDGNTITLTKEVEPITYTI